jgi:hypothetical protein
VRSRRWRWSSMWSRRCSLDGCCGAMAGGSGSGLRATSWKPAAPSRRGRSWRDPRGSVRSL